MDARQELTADQVLSAIATAKRIVADPRDYLSATVRIARALLRIHEVVARQVSNASHLGVGSRMRLSVKLLTDLHDMPGHQSLTVRITRIELGPDGIAELVLVHDEGAVA